MLLTGEQLLEVFATYNKQIWPIQILAYALGVIALVLAFRKSVLVNRIIFAILGFFWLWVALMFWLPSALQGFTIAYVFAALFLIEGLLFLIQVIKPILNFGTYKKWHTIAGLSMIFYAMVGYPVLGFFIGHRYPYTPPFGLTPCPLIIFSFGLLMLTSTKVPIILIVIPFIYGLSGVIWVSIGIWEDTGLVLSSIVSIFLILRRNKKLKKEEKIKEQDPSPVAWSLQIDD